jgi:hypothetical protein
LRDGREDQTRPESARLPTTVEGFLGSIRAPRVEFGALAVFAGRLIEFTSGQGGARPRVLPKDNAVMTGEKVKLRESLRQSHRVPYRIANHE